MDWFSYLAQQSVSSQENANTTAPAETSNSDSKAAGKGPFGGDISFWLIIGGTFVVMYFLMIRPQRKEEKRKQELLNTLAKGDSVVTNSGIIGTVAAIKDDTVTLNVGN
ncbi:MAG: preprotein translocase subunit YajC, partial [Leptospiraceae bacterium]|nr:preprotein translocase subunit YajC [Leptospiraceae bacterium]